MLLRLVHRSNNLCCGQKPRLRAAFIGQTRCQIAFCVNCYKLDACFILSTLRVSSLRPCVLTGRPICQAIARTHAHAEGGDDHFGFFWPGPNTTPKIRFDANDGNEYAKKSLDFCIYISKNNVCPRGFNQRQC